MNLQVNHMDYQLHFNPAYISDMDVAFQFCNYYQKDLGLVSEEDVQGCTEPIAQYVTTQKASLNVASNSGM